MQGQTFLMFWATLTLIIINNFEKKEENIDFYYGVQEWKIQFVCCHILVRRAVHGAL